MGDPKNTLDPGRLWVDDDRKSVIERNDDGSTTFHNERADGSWSSHTSGVPGDDTDDEPEPD